MDLATIFPGLIADLQHQLNPDVLRPIGQYLTYALGTIALIWRALLTSLKHEPINAVLAEVFVGIFALGMCLAVVNDEWVSNELRSGFTVIAATVNPDSADVSTALGQIGEAALRLLAPNNPDADTGWMETIASLPIVLLNLGFRGLTALLTLFTGIAYVASYIFTQVLFDMALMLAPICVPWLLIEKLSFVAQGWLRFIISAGMAKIVGAIMLQLTSGLILHVSEMAEAAAGEPLAQFEVYATAFLLMFLATYLMLQATSIADGLVSGSTISMHVRAATASASRIVNNTAATAASKTSDYAKGKYKHWRGIKK